MVLYQFIIMFKYAYCLKEGDLKEGIGNFYNSSSTLWERIWGEHMHHGIN